ncbi:MAG: hypothetical protein Q8Q09_09715 [Deltaproteobacteria bacterium]|nr:hypothetical protein [Deltaproteobacteria bacterium]
MQPPNQQPPHYPQHPQYQQPQYPQQGYPQQGYPQQQMIMHAGTQPKAPTGSIAAGVIGLLAGMMVFLIAGFRGRSAGWEMLAVPTLVSLVCSLVATIGGITAVVRKQFGLGLLVLGLGLAGAFLALVGFVLGS